MNLLLQSIPKRSTELNNKGAPALIKFFQTDADVLYLYGPWGSGKTTGLEVLAEEYAYEILKTAPPFKQAKVDALCAKGVFMLNRKLVIVENANKLSASDIKELSEGTWKDSKLVLIGETFPKKSPMRTHFAKKAYKFIPVKFFPFTKDDIMGCLSLYGLELGVSISYELINKIAEYATGDMRAARISLRNIVASEDEESVDIFMPFSDTVFRNDVAKLFSADKIAIKESIDTLSPYITLMIIRENILRFCPKEKKLFGLLHTYANLDINYTTELVNLAYAVGKKIKTFNYLWYRKPKVMETPNIDVDCSDAKKIIYYTGVAKHLGGK